MAGPYALCSFQRNDSGVAGKIISVGRVLVLHLIDPGSIVGIPCDFLNLPGIIPECRTCSNPECLKIKMKQINDSGVKGRLVQLEVLLRTRPCDEAQACGFREKGARPFGCSISLVPIGLRASARTVPEEHGVEVLPEHQP